MTEFIFEIGGNHQGDKKKLLSLTQKAIKAGAKRPKTIIFEKIETVEIGNGKRLFIEGIITAKTSENVNNFTTT